MSDVWLRLSLMIEPGDARLAALLRDDPPEAVLDACMGGRGLAVPARWRERAADLPERLVVAQARARQAGLRWLPRGGDGWPEQLEDLDHPEPVGDVVGAPMGLWLRGTADVAQVTRRAVAIVGARSCTAYGAEVAAELAADLGDRGWTVVSGGAFGIDASAHRGALAIDAPTVVVLACGADLTYPRAHAALVARAIDKGLAISEQLPGAEPIKSRFLSRNRVIAALAAGTVIVEAAGRSGALNTLHWADRLGRTSMGVPGPVTSQASAGVHRALRSGAAVLVTEFADVLAELDDVGWTFDDEAERGRPAELTPAARLTLAELDVTGPRTLAEVAAAAGLSAREARRAMAVLERRGLVQVDGAGWLAAGGPAAT